MVTLVGRWESGWLTDRVEYFMWKQLAHAYGVDRLVMVGKSKESRTPIDQYDTIKEALASCKGKIFLIEPTGEKSLSKLKHPKNAVYVFGNAASIVI